MRIVLLIASLMLSATVFGADPEAGKTKATICGACHGMKGISANDIWPNLAAQKQGYLVKQIKAFRDGVRSDPSMKPMVQNLTDKDIEDIAAYYSQLDGK
ncbi:MAG: cytochrome c [Proteobacteria bacterium]|jgi:cytochrome c553|nr:cytochrome c [Pseudomonadota bacterium]MDA1298695.1 cytochrome c [Pseudomonadota bacterium]